MDPALDLARGQLAEARLQLAQVQSRLEQAESRCRCLDDKLLQSQKLAAIGEIASGIAHEINNPLAIITQEAEWLEHLVVQAESGQPADLPGLRQSLAAIQAQVRRCADITHNLLGLARRWSPILQLADVNRLVEDMARLVDREAGPKGVSVARHYDRSLPKAKLDPPLFRQVILNLLVNAVQAVGQDGSVTVTTGRAPDGGFEVRVADSGPGIPPEHLARVFDPFFTTKPAGQGTGLGLSLAQRIVVHLGGHIEAQSPPGHGAIFIITLPPTETQT